MTDPAKKGQQLEEDDEFEEWVPPSGPAPLRAETTPTPCVAPDHLTPAGRRGLPAISIIVASDR